VKLSEWARKQGIGYGTALRWFHNGTLPVKSTQLSTSTILVEEPSNVNQKINKTFVYARVSSANKKEDLLRQSQLCEQFCVSKGWQIDGVAKEIASGMNDNRPKLGKILDQKGARIVCLHKDRLTRFGFNYISRLANANQGEIIVINANAVEEDDLLKDFIAIITSFCCRLYGARRGQAKALKMKESVQ